MKKISIAKLLPVLFSFFIMGFVDIVGTSTTYVQKDFGLSDTLANIIPSMVFIWFAIFSLPVGMAMNKIGRRNTVLLSAAVTTVAMVLPTISYTYVSVLAAFALLGIGNTILQVSLNPLMMNVVPEEKITSMLTLGQFVKAIASTLGPVLLAALAGIFGDWKDIFVLYAILTALSLIWMWFTRIEEPSVSENTASWKGLFSLFTEGYLMLMFAVILLCVGFEIGLMTCAPKLLQERGLDVDGSAQGNTTYYIARTISTFIGAILLAKFSPRKFLIVTVSCAVLGLGIFMTVGNSVVSFAALFILGLMCANIFAIAYSSALKFRPEKANEISALMIMGVAGGAVLSPIMGVVSDSYGQVAGLWVLMAALLFILYSAIKIKK